MLTKKLIIAIMFALLLASSMTQAGGDPIRANELRGECSDCHGEDGLGDDEYPRLAGLDEAYLFGQLLAFKSGERTNGADLMLWFLEDLEEQDLADLAAYYASLKIE